MKVMARLSLHQSDAEEGIELLMQHGYTVKTHIFPYEPDYTFVEATREIDPGTLVLDEVDKIIAGLFGFVSDAGPLEPNHVPFDYD